MNSYISRTMVYVGRIKVQEGLLVAGVECETEHRQ